VKDEILQGIFSVGDREVAKAIYFKIQNNTDWQTAWQQSGIDIETILYQSRRFENQLPWDFINYGIPKERLWKNR
jgi:hypothetical protein